MANWTDTERAALLETAHLSGIDGYKLFVERGGGAKSFDAWEVKRRRVLPDGPKAVMPIVPADDFKGLTMGYFDIETTFSTQPIMLYGAIADQFGLVEGFRKGPSIVDDRDLVNDYARALEKYDIIVSWNGKMFDIPVLNGRLAYHGLPPVNVAMHIDAMYYAGMGQMRIGRRSLQSVSEYFEAANRKTPLSVRTWDKAMSGDDEAYELIVEHCDADVLVLRDVFMSIKRQIRNIHR